MSVNILENPKLEHNENFFFKNACGTPKEITIKIFLLLKHVIYKIILKFLQLFAKSSLLVKKFQNSHGPRSNFYKAY